MATMKKHTNGANTIAAHSLRSPRYFIRLVDALAERLPHRIWIFSQLKGLVGVLFQVPLICQYFVLY